VRSASSRWRCSAVSSFSSAFRSALFSSAICRLQRRDLRLVLGADAVQVGLLLLAQGELLEVARQHLPQVGGRLLLGEGRPEEQGGSNTSGRGCRCWRSASSWACRTPAGQLLADALDLLAWMPEIQSAT